MLWRPCRGGGCLPPGGLGRPAELEVAIRRVGGLSAAAGRDAASPSAVAPPRCPGRRLAVGRAAALPPAAEQRVVPRRRFCGRAAPVAPAAFRFGCLCPGRGLVSVDRTTPCWRSGCAFWGAPRSLSGECGFLANFATLYANGAPLVRPCGAGGRRSPRSQSPGHASVSRRVRKTWRNWPEIPRMAANRRDEALRSPTGRLCLSQVGASPASQAILPGAASRVASSQWLGRPRRWWGQLPASGESMASPPRTPWGAAGSRSFPGWPVSGASCGRLGPSRRDAPPGRLGGDQFQAARGRVAPGWGGAGWAAAAEPGPPPRGGDQLQLATWGDLPAASWATSAQRRPDGAWRLMSSGRLPSGVPSPAVGLLRVSGQFRRALR